MKLFNLGRTGGALTSLRIQALSVARDREQEGEPRHALTNDEREATANRLKRRREEKKLGGKHTYQK